jgi:hypothetical protein
MKVWIVFKYSQSGELYGLKVFKEEHKAQVYIDSQTPTMQSKYSFELEEFEVEE